MALRPGQTCPEWQYTHYPDYDVLLKARAADVSVRLRGATPATNEVWCADTRIVHGPYFRDLTPPDFGHYAGHYRGESLDCLDQYEVGIKGDPVVGYPSATIPTKMNEFAVELKRAFSDLDRLWKVNSMVIGRDHQLQRTVEVAAALLVYFMEIHPYADGNGHMGRFLLLGIFARYSLYPAKFPLHPRPALPYVHLIPVYRKGNKAPLLLYILRSF
jgi:hypothetical protein